MQMKEFLNLVSQDDALQILLSNLNASPISEVISTKLAVGRITAKPVLAPHPLPEFRRSTVDGYAVRAADTYGAGESLPAYLNDIGEIHMGKSTDLVLAPTECALIHTGGMLPEGADAVVMVENTQRSKSGEMEILKAVAVGENLINIGEDVKSGQMVIPAGRRIRAAEVGGLMALGFTEVEVAKKPRVGILSSGDEVISPENQPLPGQVRDINSYTLAAVVEQVGGEAIHYGILPDMYTKVLETAKRAFSECDVVVITAGSSVSVRDLTAKVIDELGQPGVLVHGVNIRPGKPTILGVCDGKPVIGLPGNPVSALVNVEIFVAPIVKKLLGEKLDQPKPSVYAKLLVNLASESGRVEWVPVQILPSEDGWDADPVFGKSNLIFTLARADGLIRIDPDATGLSAGEIVEVVLF
jgi:molybdopterin molybdotransferase